MFFSRGLASSYFILAKALNDKLQDNIVVFYIEAKSCYTMGFFQGLAFTQERRMALTLGEVWPTAQPLYKVIATRSCAPSHIPCAG